MPSQTMPKINLLKMPDPAAQTAKYVNMMNATKQMEAAERQAATAEKRNQREEDMQVPQLAEAKTKAEVAQLEYTMKFYNETANDLANASTPDQAIARGERLKQLFPEPALQQRIDETIKDLVSDPSRFEENRKRILIRTLGAKEQFAETHSDIFDAEGNLYNKKTSNIGAFPTEITPGVVTGPANTGAAPAPAPRTPTAPQPAAPNPFAPGYKPNTAAAAPNSLSLVVDSALETGVMAKADFDKLVSIAQPGSGPKFEAWARQHNITIAPNAPGVTDNQVRGAPANLPDQMAVSPMSYDGRTPPSQFADMRGPAPQAAFANLDGAPPMQNTMAQYQVGQQIKGRNPDLSPIPGSARVAPQVLGSQKAAETAGSENVKVGTEPRIVAGVERSKRLEKLRGEMPIAQAETQTLVNSLTSRINTIDEYLRSGSRNSIIGAFEGRIPKLLQSETRSDAQGFYDYITSNTVLQKLIDDRAKTDTGASPQGVVSDADLKVAAQASTKLTQTGSERKQEIEMQRLRDELYRTRGQAIQKYNNVYREVIKEAPELGLKVRPVAPKYKSAPQTPTRAKSLKNIFGG